MEQSIGLFNFLNKKVKINKSIQNENNIVPNINRSLIVKGLTIHDDLKNLVWVGGRKI